MSRRTRGWNERPHRASEKEILTRIQALKEYVERLELPLTSQEEAALRALYQELVELVKEADADDI